MPADASSAAQAVQTQVPLLPLTIGGQRPPLRSPPPSIGEHTTLLLHSLGYGEADTTALREAGVIGTGPAT